MAFGNFMLDKGYDADAAIAKFTAVKAGSDDESVTQCDTDGEEGVGISQFAVTAADIVKGKGASVRILGITEWACAEHITREARVTCDQDGKCVNATAGDRIWGKAMTTGEADGRVSVLLMGVQIIPDENS